MAKWQFKFKDSTLNQTRGIVFVGARRNDRGAWLTATQLPDHVCDALSLTKGIRFWHCAYAKSCVDLRTIVGEAPPVIKWYHCLNGVQVTVEIQKPAAARLTIELVPESSWCKNVRSEVPPKIWDILKKNTFKVAGDRCEICGGRGPNWPVECHERWDYNDKLQIQKLIGLIALCPACHGVKHMGRAAQLGRGREALARLAQINHWSEGECVRYVSRQYAEFEKRSLLDWTLDLSWLDSSGNIPNF